MERRVFTAAAVTANEVVGETAVRTALARANWLGSIGAPANYSLAEAYVPYDNQFNPAKKNETFNRTAAMRQVTEAWAGYRLGLRLFLTNNVSYIPRLNAGASVQTSPGFLETSSAIGRAAARKVS